MKSLLLILLASILILAHATGQPLAEDKTLSPYFFVKSDNPDVDQLPLKSTRADVNIAGVIADVSVTQVYKNEGNSVLEAIYVFPASTKAAVYGMTMQIGDRKITAKIRERGQAQREYAQAKAEGKRVSLLEQDRPNVFQMQVANIAPGDEIEVVLNYTEELVPTDGIYEFIYPTVVGPRYSEKKASDDTDKSNDYLSSPYLKAGEKAPFEVDIQVHLAAGMPIQNISSTSHKIQTNYGSTDQAWIQLKPEETNPGNRDYILQYQLAGGEIQSGLMLYEHEDENFFMMMVQPPKRVQPKQIPPREYIFIVDVSGSMNGFPMEVSQKLLRDLITGLRPTDRFNVLLFASSSMVLSEEPLEASSDNVATAVQFLGNQRGGGGTRLLPALKRGLELPRCDENLSRSIVVVTDGFVAVEREAFDLVRTRLDEANLFAFGIGSSVNRYLIEGLARSGQAEPFIVTSLNEAPPIADKFREYINTPVLTQAKIKYNGFDAYDVEPLSIPDVLADRPVIVHGKYRGKAKGTITLEGFAGDTKYKSSFKVNEVSADRKNSALRYLWARERIKTLGDYQQVSADGTLVNQITELGLQYNLMTAYTSFIAIDEYERIDNSESKTVKQALPMPEGVSNMAVGFDAEIDGLVRRKPAKTAGLQLKELKSDLPEEIHAALKKELIRRINKISSCKSLKGQLLTLDIKIDKNGKISLVLPVGPVLTSDAEKCLIAAIEKWQFTGWQQETNSTIQITIQ